MQATAVNTPGDVVVWLVNQTLETVTSHAQRKTPVKSEWRRQMMIAEAGLDWTRYYSIPASGTALMVQTEHDGDVRAFGLAQRAAASLPHLDVQPYEKYQHNRVNSPMDAMNYLLDCIMATVDDYIMSSRPPRKAFAREIEIAQKTIDWARALDVPLTGRAKTAITHYGGSVQRYAEEKRA